MMTTDGRSSIRFQCILALSAAALTLHAAAPAFAQDAACKAVVDAFALLANTPNHQFTLQRDRSGTSTAESINTGTMLYVRTQGKWSGKPFSPAAEIMTEAARARSQKSTCRRVRDENVEGIEASRYSVQTKADYGASDAKLWIAKANGLPVRQEIKRKQPVITPS
jgi:hypothetical protein